MDSLMYIRNVSTKKIIDTKIISPILLFVQVKYERYILIYKIIWQKLYFDL